MEERKPDSGYIKGLNASAKAGIIAIVVAAAVVILTIAALACFFPATPTV